jgi:hypothetical protein
MGRLIDQAGLAAAWRALSGHGEPGWRTIPLGAIGPVQVLAGRRFPGNEEAVLFGIPGYRRPANEQLPSGRGFEILRVTLKEKDEEPRWLGVNREAQGSFDLFAMMITDLLEHLASRDADTSPDELGTALVARVRAWQEFMQRGSGVLGPEAEVGLVGELRFLEALLESGLAISEVLDGWKGPLDGLHDFAFPGGAIEVKSTVASVGCTAEVSCLEQLDDSVVAPLFLGAVRLSVGPGGITLPEQIERLRGAASEPSARAHLDEKLLRVGYFDRFAERYTRRFRLSSLKAFRVDADFPRLVHGSVPPAVRRARYDIDLDATERPTTSLDDVMSTLGLK